MDAVKERLKFVFFFGLVVILIWIPLNAIFRTGSGPLRVGMFVWNVTGISLAVHFFAFFDAWLSLNECRACKKTFKKKLDQLYIAPALAILLLSGHFILHFIIFLIL